MEPAARKRPASRKRKSGAKSTYRPEFVERVRRYAAMGLIEPEIAKCFGRAHRTIKDWRIAHPEFDKAMRVGKEVADHRVEQSLYHNSIGFYYEAQKIVVIEGKPQIVKYQAYVLPDTTAQIFWLKNRLQAEWRDRREYIPEAPPPAPELEGPQQVSLDDARRIAWLLRDRTTETQH